MCIFANHKDIFGKPNEGVHSIRLFDFAIVDIIMTFIGAYILSQYYKKNVWLIFILIFIYGQILHALFCVKTKFISLFCHSCIPDTS
jgi:hypothetical protein